MAKTQTLPWDPAEHLETEEDVVAYLEAAYEYDDPNLMADVLDVIKRAMGVAEMAERWAGLDGTIGAYIREESEKSLESYRSQPNNLREDANQEEDTARGGYANRQLFELVQNSADALAESDGEYIWIRLTPTHLYCADNGQPIDQNGARALLFSHLSSKRGTSEIGRFGLGFKSVLGVTDTPEFFSRAGSFRFDRARSANLLSSIAPDIDRYPVLRLAEPIDPWPEIETDSDLREMVYWATNIVRLPLKPGAHQTLDEQIKEFPAEFLLFVEHVGRLVLQTNEQEVARIVTLIHEDGRWILDDAGNKTRWMIERRLHNLSSDAKSDSRSLDDADEVPIWWAAPINRLNDPGKFWAFFPTMTQSPLPGILNAPWKTNEDRQNLLPGTYNDELIDAAVEMVADALPRLSTSDDPARHLDVLPRREESWDTDHSNRLRDQLYSSLQGREIVPDQAGELRKLMDISYPPRQLTPDRQMDFDPFERWAEHAIKDWLHHSALTNNHTVRIARLDQLYSSQTGRTSSQLPRASVSQWLEALVEKAKVASETIRWLETNVTEYGWDATKLAEPKVALEQSIIQSSQAAIQTASLIPRHVRESNYLGDIVLTVDGRWVPPNPDIVRLSGRDFSTGNNLVHPESEADTETLSALKELGIRPASPETVFKDLASKLLRTIYANRDREDFQTGSDREWREFWQLASEIDQSNAVETIREHEHWPDSLRVRTISERWRSLFDTLLPGRVVPDDGSRDRDIAIDTQFHEVDLPLLNQLGVRDATHDMFPLSRDHRRKFTSLCRRKFTQQDLPSNPQQDKLNFESTTTSGPLDLLEALSEDGKALFTWDLLGLPATYQPWMMRHDTRRDYYGAMDFDSPAIEALREHGRIRTTDGIHKLSDGLGDPPQNPTVLRQLLRHPRASLIREAFGIEVELDTPVETFGEDDPIPLLDAWPGLEPHLSLRQADIQLIRCDRILVIDDVTTEPGAASRNGVVYIVRGDDEREELRTVLREIGLLYTDQATEGILVRQTPGTVEALRHVIRNCSTDAERLLAAVGETQLRWHLPEGLIEILEDVQGPLDGVQVADAALATFHTGALREYRHALGRLDPPKRWAGSPRAVEFVRSLGFGEEWAGDRNTRRDPYIEVDGPYWLPPLHDYQRRVVGNVRRLLRSNGMVSERRGMISMPTGSGKTRVAVQSVVEAIREDDFKGGILWVADRDELCEQAVEAWRQVWAGEGAQATQLRISRMWAGQPRPLPTGDLHVIVATIQTLSTKIAHQPESYEFLADFKLLVFDEAHRSVAPTFTSVMQELGLTRWRRAHEPLMIGLTATPYKGYDEAETRRLVNRYGSNRLDAGAFSSDDPEDVIRELQEMQILARADHVTIEGGEFSLYADELRQSRDVPWLPRSVEDRIARDTDRTKRIVQEYMNHIDPDWPTLIFATSVEHAQTLSALLNSMGVRSRAVSSSTDRSIRRRVVEEFRNGDIKTLVNYAVFREGFDAPKTRAIIVARPVYSPNLYFQMIGRGLRGVKNGGNDRCLILNVRDNIENFERKLAFSDLDWLWD